MATQATPLRHPSSSQAAFWPWFREFIRWELAPYPGRLNTVTRMTVAATLVMIIVMTFRLPNGVLGGLFSILLARENLAATWRGGRIIVIAFVIASLYTLFGMILFRGYPITHFFWVIGTLYLIFFVVRTTTNYAAAVAFAIPIGVAFPFWDRPLPSELQVESTLWLLLIVAVGAGATFATEAIYWIFDRSDPLVTSLDGMLLAVQQLAENVASHHPPDSNLRKVHQYYMTGTGRLRTALLRQGLDPTQQARRGAMIFLSGRLIELAENIERKPPWPVGDEEIRLRGLAESLAAIRMQLRGPGPANSTSPPALEGLASPSFPMLQELERTAALMSEVLQRREIVVGPQNPPGRPWWRALFVPDAFQNLEYSRFAFAGCLAASTCYILYNALDWPGISTSVLTCIVTAVTTIGASLQAQYLRITGFVLGGLVMGISAQILILPGIDSIFGFALFIATGTAIAAWFATSSPRLSFLGVQTALAFYFVNLQDFQIETDLRIARDKVAGALLGILAMGFIFDRFGTKREVEQLPKLLSQNIRMLAQLAVSTVLPDRAIAVSQISRLRIQINDNFATLTSQIDAAQFESKFRHRREEDIAECERIQRAQPALRSIYLLELSLQSHRGRSETGSELTVGQHEALDHFLKEYSSELMHIAAWIADEGDAPARVTYDSIGPLQHAFEEHSSPNSLGIMDICQRMISSLVILREEC